MTKVQALLAHLRFAGVEVLQTEGKTLPQQKDCDSCGPDPHRAAPAVPAWHSALSLAGFQQRCALPSAQVSDAFCQIC